MITQITQIIEIVEFNRKNEVKSFIINIDKKIFKCFELIAKELHLFYDVINIDTNDNYYDTQIFL